jgi:arginyl-tRNA synthetase
VAAERGIPRPLAIEADLSVLTNPDELGLIRKLSAFPEILQTSAAAFEPHRVTYYLQQLAALLHTFYNKHRILPAVGDQEQSDASPIEELTPDKTAGRLVLMRGVQQVIHNGLAVLGISAPEQM